MRKFILNTDKKKSHPSVEQIKRQKDFIKDNGIPGTIKSLIFNLRKDKKNSN